MNAANANIFSWQEFAMRPETDIGAHTALARPSVEILNAVIDLADLSQAGQTRKNWDAIVALRHHTPLRVHLERRSISNVANANTIFKPHFTT